MHNDASTKAYKCKIVQEITSLYEESRRRNHYNEKKKNPVCGGIVEGGFLCRCVPMTEKAERAVRRMTVTAASCKRVMQKSPEMSISLSGNSRD